jgi:flagellar basal-body rod protein FlgG
MTTIVGSAAGGLAQSQAMMDTVANNLANVNTPGFKRFRALAEGAPAPERIGNTVEKLGVADASFDAVYTTAAALGTEDPLNFAITDDAFLKVTGPDGSPAYTRLGYLQADADGHVSLFGGVSLDPPVTAPGLTAFAVDPSGAITGLDSSGTRVLAGQVTLARFVNPQGLLSLGSGLYAATENTGAVTEGTPGDGDFAALLPGTLEASNVNVAEEFTNMIIAQRAYQANAKTYSVGDDMLALAANLTK